MSHSTLVLCYPVDDAELSRIQTEFSHYDVLVSSQEAITEDIFHADVFCGHAKSTPIDWGKVVSFGRLKWIQSSAAGLDHCLAPAVIESEIVVSGCSGLFANQVAEQTMAILYGLIRRLSVFNDAKQKREFVRRPTDDLHGKKVGIVGFGGNGRRIAELLSEVVSEIHVTDLFPEFDIPDYIERSLPASEISELFKCCEILIITLPLNSNTEKLIDAKLFALLQPNSYFLNVARGGVVNQKDLVHALQSGTIGFAGLDVVDPEPLPKDSPLWEMDNVILTPHVGAQSKTRVSLTTELLCANRARFEAGETLVNQVDKMLFIPHPSCRLTVGKDGTIRLPAML